MSNSNKSSTLKYSILSSLSILYISYRLSSISPSIKAFIELTLSPICALFCFIFVLNQIIESKRNMSKLKRKCI